MTTVRKLSLCNIPKVVFITGFRRLSNLQNLDAPLIIDKNHRKKANQRGLSPNPCPRAPVLLGGGTILSAISQSAVKVFFFQRNCFSIIEIFQEALRYKDPRGSRNAQRVRNSFKFIHLFRFFLKNTFQLFLPKGLYIASAAAACTGYVSA